MKTELAQKVRNEGWYLPEVLYYLNRNDPDHNDTQDVTIGYIQRAFMFDHDLAQEIYDYWTKNRNESE